MINIQKSFTATFLALFSVTVLVVSPALAAETVAQSTRKAQVTQGLVSPTPRPKISLTGNRLQSCMAREKSVKTRSESLTKMANNMLEVFDKISARVQDYYTRSGVTVTRYSTLVSEMETNRNLVVVALNKATTEASDFTCTTDDPKGLMSQFQTDMRSVKNALKAYRTSVKNLIVAVRTATATVSASPKPSMSPKPSESPKTTKTPNPRSNSQGRGNN